MPPTTPIISSGTSASAPSVSSGASASSPTVSSGASAGDSSQRLRASWHDYSAPGFYMLTLATHGRRPLLGRLGGQSAEQATITLTDIGKALTAEIESQPRRHPELRLLEYIIMEDHCHILLEVMLPLADHLGKIVWGIKYGSTSAYLNQLNAQHGGVHRIEGTRSSSSQRKLKADSSGSTAPNSGSPIQYVSPLWEAGYHDRIICRNGQITRLTHYIRRNPARLWLKRHAPRAFTQVRDIEHPFPLPLAQRLKEFALYWDERRTVTRSHLSHRADNSYYASTYCELTQKFLWKRTEPFLRLRACGGLHLLYSGRPLARVRISRSISPADFAKEKERLLTLCEQQGAILISPFISPGEKAIKEAALAEGYPLIILHGEEMSTLWKPQDDLIDATYRGSILFLSPWPNRPRGQRPQKPDMELMNELCLCLELASQ